MIKQVLKYIKDNKENLEISRFRGHFWHNYIAFSKLGKDLGTIHFSIYKKGEKNDYWLVLDKKILAKTGENLYKEWKNRLSFFKKIFYSLLKQAKENINPLFKTHCFNTPVFLNIVKSLAEVCRFTAFKFEAIDIYLQKLIEQEINDKDRDILLFPFYESYIQKRTSKAIEIIESLPKISEDILLRYRKEWGWTFCNFASDRYPSIGELHRFFRNLRANLKKEKNLIENAKKKRALKRKRLKRVNPKVKKLINFLDVLYELRDERKGFFNFWILTINTWFKKLALNYGLKLSDIQWLTNEEHIALDKKNKKGMKKLLKTIKERGNNCVAIYNYKNTKNLIFTGREAKQIISLLFKKEQKKILKGISVFRGVVKGVVRVITDTKDFPKFKKGEILVISHTTPDFAPTVKKASAILTQRGGITCHAAIISREFSIPCIVGIKGLMDSLNTGDIVEVDANKGIIKLLKRS